MLCTQYVLFCIKSKHAFQVAANKGGATRLDQAPLLAQRKKAVDGNLRTAKGMTAVERIQQKALSKSTARPSAGGKRDAAEAFLEDL